MGLATLVNTSGDGLLLAGGVVFFTRSVGLSAGQVGTGLTAAGLIGLLVSVPVGHICDRYGPREVLLVLLALQTVVTGCYVAVHSFPAFVVVATLGALGVAGAAPARGALVAGLAEQTTGGRVMLRASLRSLTNTGIAVGALAAAPVLALDSRPAYLAMVCADAATYAVAGLLLARVPRVPPAPAPPAQHRWVALHDPSYLAVAAVSGLMSLQYDVLPLALPLWITMRTTAYRGLLGPLLFVNTAMVATLQTVAARRTDGVIPAALAVRRAGWVLAIACAVFAATSQVGAVPAAVGLFAGVVIHTCGELSHAAGGFGLSFGLAAPTAHGQYQAVFGLGISGARAIAPLVLSALVIGLGVPGWLILAGLFMLAGLLIAPTARWAQLRRVPP
jgi:MFS family permease